MSVNGDFGADFIYAARCSRYQRQNPPMSTTRRPPSTAFSTMADDVFTDDEIYYFMVIKLKPAQARQILRDDPPPTEFYEMDAVVKAGYLFYYGVYKQHFPYDMQIFVKRFYKEFYKHTCDNMSDEEALKKICNHTYKEWQRNQAKVIAERRQLMHDGRSTPDSRTSLSSFEDSDLLSLDSAAKEPLKFRTHHTLVRFGPGGRLIILSPRESISTIRIDHLKSHIANRSLRRNIDLMESFKGPLIYNETQPHTLQLFIERQIREIYNSDVYKGNPDSSDTNDCLLIWRLLQMLIKQHGRVTGPDLAQLLIEDSRIEDDLRFTETKSPLVAQPSVGSMNDETSDLAECTNFLLRGCVDEAINSAIQDGCLFDALILAESLYAARPDKLAAIRARLLATRSAQHPLSTLISVAESRPLPLLTSTNTGDGRGWRAHVAILLANLQSPVAYDSIYRLGLDLAKKEFNSAADFCFLAVNLLSGYNCFAPTVTNTSEVGQNRQGISLINATLPDDSVHSAQTAYGWSILDFCATEIFEFALRLASGGHETLLSQSPVMQKYRGEYAQMLDSLGGFDSVVRAYSQLQGSVQSQKMFSIAPQPTYMPSYPAPQRTVKHEESAPAPVVQAPNKSVPAPKQDERSTSEERTPTSSTANASTSSAQPLSPVAVTSTSNVQASTGFVQPPTPTTPSAVSTSLASVSISAPTVSVQSYQQQAPKQVQHAPKPVQENRPMHDEQSYKAPTSVPAQTPFVQASIRTAPPAQNRTTPNLAPMNQPQKLAPQKNENQSGKEETKKMTKSASGGSSRWLGGFLEKIIPASNEMILPKDDHIPDKDRIRWDPVEGRYVGGVQQEEVPPPPPMSIPAAPQSQPETQTESFQQPSSPSFQQPVMPTMPTMPDSVQGAQPTRTSSLRRGANRYSNAFVATGGATTSSGMANPMLPPSFPTSIDES